MLGFKLRCAHAQGVPSMPRQNLVDARSHAMLHGEALSPQKRNGGNRGTERLTQSSTLGGRAQHEDEKQQQWTALSGSKKNDENRPDDVGSMRQQAKKSRGPLAKAQANKH